LNKKVFRGLLGVTVFLVASATAFARTEQNSFLNRPSNNLPELLNQIKSDDKVSSRYMRHFGMTKGQVLDMVSKLKLDRLPSDGTFLVYNVPKWEEVRARALVFKKGTLVWADASGRPVLKASCGNPMVRGTDLGQTAAVPALKLDAVSNVRDLTPLTPPETTFMDYEADLLQPGTLQVNAADFPPALPGIPALPGLGFPMQIFPIIGVLGILGGGGGSNGGPPTVPEPCSMLALGLGIAALAAHRRPKGLSRRGLREDED